MVKQLDHCGELKDLKCTCFLRAVFITEDPKPSLSSLKMPHLESMRPTQRPEAPGNGAVVYLKPSFPQGSKQRPGLVEKYGVWRQARYVSSVI